MIKKVGEGLACVARYIFLWHLLREETELPVSDVTMERREVIPETILDAERRFSIAEDVAPQQLSLYRRGVLRLVEIARRFSHKEIWKVALVLTWQVSLVAVLTGLVGFLFVYLYSVLVPPTIMLEHGDVGARRIFGYFFAGVTVSLFTPFYIGYSLWFVTKDWTVLSQNRQFWISCVVTVLLLWVMYLWIFLGVAEDIGYFFAHKVALAFISVSYSGFVLLGSVLFARHHGISWRDRRAYYWAAADVSLLVSSLVVILSFGLLLVYLESLALGLVWRIVLYPLWFELTMIFPMRWYSKYLHSLQTDISRAVYPLLHAHSHVSTLGRLALFSVGSSNSTALFVVVFAVTIVEVSIRVTVLKRDKFSRSLVPCLAEKMSHDDYRQNVCELVLIDMLFEIPGVFAASALLAFILRDIPVFVALDIGPTALITSTLLQVCIEVAGILASLIIMCHLTTLPLVSVWKRIITRQFLTFLLYSFLAMGTGVMVTMGFNIFFDANTGAIV